MKFNVIIAKRNREDYLQSCLHYLKIACMDKKHDVVVYVSSDSDTNYKGESLSSKEGLVTHYYYVVNNGMFNKSILLNNSIFNMRKDFDVLTMIDIDMIYPPNFFDSISKTIKSFDYIVSTGFKLNGLNSEYIRTNLPDINSDYFKNGEYFPKGPSQISMNRKCYDIFIKKWGHIYNDEYKAWGHEDSDISFKSEFLRKKRFITKGTLPKVWYHLHHDKNSFNQEQYNKNEEVFQKMRSQLIGRESHG